MIERIDGCVESYSHTYSHMKWMKGFGVEKKWRWDNNLRWPLIN